MPIYEFECANCGRKSELFAPMNGPIPRCPYCNKDKLVKIPSISNFRIDGYSEKNGYSKTKK